MAGGRIIVDSDGYIVIPMVIRGTFRDNYEISPSQAGAGLDYWLSHLKEKNWFTPELESDLRGVFAQLS